MSTTLQTKLFDVDFLQALSARYDTPCYIYSQELIEAAIDKYHSAFGGHAHLICYAVKANSNLSILSILRNLGCGFDIVSMGELRRCLSIGVDPKRIVYSGVGKTDTEIQTALQHDIGCFNCESLEEISVLNRFACSMNKTAHIGLRVNPNIDAQTHPYISTGLNENKFGITVREVRNLLAQIQSGALNHIKVIAIGFHIGSQLMDMTPVLESIECMIPLMDEFEAISKLHHIDIGGGLGIDYNMVPFRQSGGENIDDCNIDGSLSGQELYHRFKHTLFDRIEQYIDGVKKTLKKYARYKDLAIVCEPGRSVVGYAGILLSRVLFVKQRRTELQEKDFVIIDSSMSELIRPVLYGGQHPTVLLKTAGELDEQRKVADIVGPVCESGDFLGKKRKICGVRRGDLMVICHCGAYGMSMSSNYNSRPLVTELLIDNLNHVRLIKSKQDIDCLFKDEKRLLKLLQCKL